MFGTFCSNCFASFMGQGRFCSDKCRDEVAKRELQVALEFKNHEIKCEAYRKKSNGYDNLMKKLGEE